MLKQMTTLTLKLKLPIIFPSLLMNFENILQDSFKDMVHKYAVDISLTDEEIKHTEYSTWGNKLLICGGSVEKKHPQHLIFTLQLLTK